MTLKYCLLPTFDPLKDFTFCKPLFPQCCCQLCSMVLQWSNLGHGQKQRHFTTSSESSGLVSGLRHLSSFVSLLGMNKEPKIKAVMETLHPKP